MPPTVPPLLELLELLAELDALVELDELGVVLVGVVLVGEELELLLLDGGVGTVVGPVLDEGGAAVGEVVAAVCLVLLDRPAAEEVRGAVPAGPELVPWLVTGLCWIPVWSAAAASLVVVREGPSPAPTGVSRWMACSGGEESMMFSAATAAPVRSSAVLRAPSSRIGCRCRRRSVRCLPR
ncbi:MAG TPA: hypothetical protein VFP72_09675 [Kineosporiaceae bacterium]|nr:hypothetical protein [Kineosporiaceae bacterium]